MISTVRIFNARIVITSLCAISERSGIRIGHFGPGITILSELS